MEIYIPENFKQPTINLKFIKRFSYIDTLKAQSEINDPVRDAQNSAVC